MQSDSTPLSLVLDGTLPCGLVLTSYGGGDDFALARPVLHRTFSHSFSPTVAFKERVIAATIECLKMESTDPDMRDFKKLCDSVIELCTCLFICFIKLDAQ